MDRYVIQIQRLMFASNGRSIKKLHVYDIDGTLIPFSRKGKRVEQKLVRQPLEPYILLSARASEHKGFTRKWCDYNGLQPLAIFHRDIDLWSFEEGNINFYKPCIIRQIRTALPHVELMVFDDENIDFCAGSDVTFKLKQRVCGNGGAVCAGG